MKNNDIVCEAKNCKKIIGYKRKNGKKVYYDGTVQFGFKSACCEAHLNK